MCAGWSIISKVDVAKGYFSALYVWPVNTFALQHHQMLVWLCQSWYGIGHTGHTTFSTHAPHPFVFVSTLHVCERHYLVIDGRSGGVGWSGAMQAETIRNFTKSKDQLAKKKTS